MEWRELQPKLIQTMDSLCFLPVVLVKEISQYCAPTSWKGELLHQWNLPTKCYPFGLVSNGVSLFVCAAVEQNALHCYNLKDHRLEETWTLKIDGPKGIDLANDELYILDRYQVSVFSRLNKNLLRQWYIPTSGLSFGAGLKVYEKEIFLTVYPFHQIFVYNQFGLLLKKYGTEEAGSDPGQFNFPKGITVDCNYIYICDCWNHRIQVLRRDNGLYSHQWGSYGNGNSQFRSPQSIHLSEEGKGEGLLYVGDHVGVQVFTKEGTFLHRFGKNERGSGDGEFTWIHGLHVVQNRLFISDYGNHRIQMWR